jgi:hypothetical protein
MIARGWATVARWLAQMAVPIDPFVLRLSKRERHAPSVDEPFTPRQAQGERTLTMESLKHEQSSGEDSRP